MFPIIEIPEATRVIVFRGVKADSVIQIVIGGFVEIRELASIRRFKTDFGVLDDTDMGVAATRGRGGTSNDESRRSNGAKRNRSENGDTECHHFLGLFLHLGVAHLVQIPLLYIYIDIEQLGGRSIRFNDYSEGNGIFRRFSSSLCHNRIEIIHRLFENFIGNRFAGSDVVIFRRI